MEEGHCKPNPGERIINKVEFHGFKNARRYLCVPLCPSVCCKNLVKDMTILVFVALISAEHSCVVIPWCHLCLSSLYVLQLVYC